MHRNTWPKVLFPHHDKMPSFDNFQAGTMSIVSASDRRKIQAFS
ncbi:hypothetical protein X772_02250 [Mesorhizobium sp. LSJC280B00]|nr:hypothetical protein X772_02250 [Mesorhizobium sp. LSJC280B00]